MKEEKKVLHELRLDKSIIKLLWAPALVGQLQKLVQKNIINSIKGPHGGFFIQTENNTTMLSEIVEAIDGDQIMNGCALGLKKCSEDHPCPLHFDFVDIRGGLKQMLKTNSIIELSSKLDSGTSFLKI
mgnify:CR=1 FL=1